MTRILLLLTMAAVPVAAHQGRDPEPAGAQANLRIDVVAVDGKGAPVTDLRPSEFEVWISGYRVPIEDVYARDAGGKWPRTMVLVLDNGAVGPELAFACEGCRSRSSSSGWAPTTGWRWSRSTAERWTAQTTAHDCCRRSTTTTCRDSRSGSEDAGEHVLRMLETIARRMPETRERPQDDRRHRCRLAVRHAAASAERAQPRTRMGRRDADDGRHEHEPVRDRSGRRWLVRGAGTYGGDSGFADETGGYAFVNTNDHRRRRGRGSAAESGTYYVLAHGESAGAADGRSAEVEVKVLRKGVTVRATAKGIPQENLGDGTFMNCAAP